MTDDRAQIMGDRLLRKIGTLVVENDVLREQLAHARAQLEQRDAAAAAEADKRAARARRRKR